MMLKHKPNRRFEAWYLMPGRLDLKLINKRKKVKKSSPIRPMMHPMMHLTFAIHEDQADQSGDAL